MGWLDDLMGGTPAKSAYDPERAKTRLDKLAASMGASEEEIAPYRALLEYNSANYGDIAKATEENSPSKWGTAFGAPMVSVGTLLASDGRETGIPNAQHMVDGYWGGRDKVTDVLKANAENASKYGSMLVESGMKRKEMQRKQEMLRDIVSGGERHVLHPAGDGSGIGSNPLAAPAPIPGTSIGSAPPLPRPSMAQMGSPAAAAQQQEDAPPPAYHGTPAQRPQATQQAGTQVGSQAAPVNNPGRPASTSKYQIAETDLRPVPYSQEKIAAASVIDDKFADNMRQANDQVMKENDQRIKMAEQQRAAAQNDPELAAEIEESKTTAKAKAEAKIALPGAVGSAERMLRDIEAAKSDPNLKSVTGSVQGRIPGWAQTEGMARAQSRIDKVKGQAFLQAFQSLKGGGAITEMEGAKAEQALTRLSHSAQTMGDDDFQSALDDARKEVFAVVNLARAKAGMPPVAHEEDAADKAEPAPKTQAAPPGALTRDNIGVIVQRFESADSVTKQAIVEDLKRRGIDPSFLSGGVGPQSALPATRDDEDLYSYGAR
jgi:hypothetical protein